MGMFTEDSYIDPAHEICISLQKYEKLHKDILENKNIIQQLIAWIEQSPHKGFCSRFNNNKSEHKCACGRDELIKLAKGESK